MSADNNKTLFENMIHPRGPMCLVGVWKVSNMCLEGITIVPEF